MADVIVIGDGPGGLSAALFLAKNGLQVEVFGLDQSAMHAAELHNYLGIPRITGTEFQRIAREQVRTFGAVLRDEKVEAVTREGDGFTVVAGGRPSHARYLVLSEGKNPVIGPSLGIAPGSPTDTNSRTAVDRVYAVGRMVRPGRSQAIVSAGAGAAAALDILAREKGQDAFVDWDVPERGPA